MPIKFLMFLLFLSLSFVRTNQPTSSQKRSAKKKFESNKFMDVFYVYLFIVCMFFILLGMHAKSQQEEKLLFSFHFASIEYKRNRNCKVSKKISHLVLLLFCYLWWRWKKIVNSVICTQCNTELHFTGKYLYADYITQSKFFSYLALVLVLLSLSI